MNQPPRRITVLVVDDSGVSRDLLTHLLTSEPGIEVIGYARNGEEACAIAAEKNPDVVTMDIHMPGLDGFETTRRIMETQPRPIVIVSANFNRDDVPKLFRALEAGAVAAVEKPPGPGHSAHAELARQFLDTVKAMADVRVIRRWPRGRSGALRPPARPQPPTHGPLRLVVVGASTGGPPALQRMLAGLPQPCPVPVVIVQHISAGFIEGLADWLTATTGLPTRLAQHGELAPSGTALLAPDGFQTAVARDGRIICQPEPAEHGLRPAVSYLFRATAQNFGPRAAGVLLTGMGIDGAAELKLMRDAGAVTLAQDQESSIIHGMPGEAIRLGAATHVGNPERLAAVLHAMLTPLLQQPSP